MRQTCFLVLVASLAAYSAQGQTLQSFLGLSALPPLTLSFLAPGQAPTPAIISVPGIGPVPGPLVPVAPGPAPPTVPTPTVPTPATPTPTTPTPATPGTTGTIVTYPATELESSTTLGRKLLAGVAVSNSNDVTFNTYILLGNAPPVTPITTAPTYSGTAPTGTITITDEDGTLVGQAVVPDGTATTTATLANGLHKLTTAYSGDANYAASSSSLPYTVLVQASSSGASGSLPPPITIG